MDIKEALAAFDALSQDTRLRVFRLLVEHGPSGVPAGTLSESLNIPHNTLSFHLRHMSHAGLVLSQREGKSIIYSANFEFFSGLYFGRRSIFHDVKQRNNGGDGEVHIA